MAEPAFSPTGEPGEVRVTVRFFAAARAAAGAEQELVAMPPGATLADLVAALAGRSVRLSNVLARCSYLCDGVAVTAEAVAARALVSGQNVDVLPPFAGG